MKAQLWWMVQWFADRQGSCRGGKVGINGLMVVYCTMKMGEGSGLEGMGGTWDIGAVLGNDSVGVWSMSSEVSYWLRMEQVKSI